MVNCPKCNFNQPKDQFCANCGIDMAAYQPVQPPFFIKLAKNWIFQLSSITVVVIIGVALTRAQNRAQIAESFAVLEQVTSRQRNFLSKKPVDQKVSKNVERALPEASAAPEPPQAPELTTASALASNTPPATAAASASVKPNDGTPTSAEAGSNLPPTKLKLVFVEVNRASLAALAGDSRSVASAGTYFSGMLPEGSRSEIGMPGLTVLDSASDLQMKPNQPIVVFKGSRDPQLEQNIGVTTQITPTFIDEQGAHLQIEVKRTLRAPAGSASPLIEETYQEQMILKKDSKGFMSGLLPHRVLNEEEARLLGANPTILKVLASSDFQTSNSEFVVFIEAK